MPEDGMKKRLRSQDKEEGIALLLAIVALLLITAAGLALMFSSDTETAISVNYRDKQVAIYGALAGLEEARNRIHPTQGDLKAIVPKGLPTTGQQNVLYILNPANGETVAPWDPSNPYFDQELCQENVLGMTQGPSGVPCPASSLPSGNWYKTINNTSGTWHLTDTYGAAAPLSYKWVRVTLKHTNMTPVQVGAGGNQQVCWNNNHESIIPAGYNTDCTPPSAGVTNITVTNPGTKYTSTPTVRITGGSGSGATAQAIVGPLPSGLTSVWLTDGGGGYTSTPQVRVVPPDGNGCCAEVVATLTGSQPVSSVTLQNNGTPACYPVGTAPGSFTVAFNPPGATGSVTAMTGNRCISSFSVAKCSDNGNTGKNLSGVVITASGGFRGTFNTDKNKTGYNFQVTDVGNADYSIKPSFTYSFPNGGSCTVASSDVAVTYGIQISSATGTGGAYSAPPTVSFSGPIAALGNNGGTTGIGNLSGSQSPSPVSGVKISTGMTGSGYLVDPNLDIDPPPSGGTQATGKASIEHSDGVVGVKILTAGTGYTAANPPTVTIDPPGGGGVQALAFATVGSGGSYQGAVYLITAFAQTPTGARAMAQMEVGVNYQTYPLVLGGALTLAGPSPSFTSPNSQPFHIDGVDHAGASASEPPGCKSANKYPSLPAIGVYDDPNNPTSPTAQNSVISDLGKPNNYVGKGTAPDIENAFGSLGGATPATLNTVVASVASVATNTYGTPSAPTSVSNINMGTAANPAIDVIYGNYTMSGNQTGYGILVVTGTLTFSGDFKWNGLVLVIGNGAAILNGGGNGQINGSVFVANTAASNSVLGSPAVQFAGGGGNGIYYDHCWADDMLAKVPWIPTPSSSELQVISTRFLDI